MPPDVPSAEEQLEPLPQDNQAPFQPADPPRDEELPPDSSAQPTAPHDATHPVTDSDVDNQEAYDAGMDVATNNEEPNSDNSIVGYEKPHDS